MEYIWRLRELSRYAGFGIISACFWFSAGCSSEDAGSNSGAQHGSGGSGSPGQDGGGIDIGTDSGSGGPNSGKDGNSACSPDLTGTVRDFRDSHPDFESFLGQGEKGIVEFELGDDFKPVYASSTSTELTSGKANFDQWYRDVDGVNDSILFEITLTEGNDGIWSYDNSEFFPIDGQGFGNEGRSHNYHFTFELHTEFRYRAGDVFTFTGDDDLFVFINRKLALDLGGLHPPQTDTVDLDAQAEELGIEVGNTYELSLFHAERHTEFSNFRIDTTLKFTNCNPIVH